MTHAAAQPSELPPDAIAIVGLAGRFPGADDVATLWENLCAGREGIERLSDETLRAAGLGEADLANPKLVKAGGVIREYDAFDAGFFGINPREAEVLDPQHRMFFESAWSALESAGVDPARFAGSIGVFAGTGLNTYLLYNLAANPAAVAAVGVFSAAIASDKDALTQRLAYLLNLRGPAVTVQSACSTSLVAVQLACQSLQAYQCDLALAGGVTVKTPHRAGYFYTEGGVSSPDGHCRSFDASAHGTVPASGCGVVALRRLADAVADGDAIIAVIRGAAANNDGAAKVGFTAPGVDGQAEVIALAQAAAQVEPESIGLVEAHGTATPLGDPIEVAALTRVFRVQTDRRGFCALGSVKSNLGHLDAAAGVTGLIKAALAVEQGVVPPTLHFQSPNPEAALPESPFFVNTVAQPWPLISGPRRAGVSSFGIGGTNAHVVLEEAPLHLKSEVSNFKSAAAPLPLWLPLSARSEPALAKAGARLAAWLEANPAVALADVARTLQCGRRGFARRRVICAATVGEAIAALRAGGDAPDLPAEVAAWRQNPEAVWPEGFAAAGRTVWRLPTYPFERTRYWIDPAKPVAAGAHPAMAPSRDPADWCYRATWRRSDVRATAPVFSDIAVWRRGDGLMAESRVLLDFQGCSTAEAFAALRTQALAGPVTEIVAVADGVLAVEGGDITAPDLAAVLGLSAVLGQERPAVRLRILDLGGLAGEARLAVASSEFGAPAEETVVAWRAGRRWVRGWGPVRLEPTAGWRERGVYVVTGGFGRLGLALAMELARSHHVRLVLIGRRGASGAEAAVRAVEAAGAEVMVVAADVADEGAMRAALTAAEARWGAVHGVIHAAGVTGKGSVRAVAETDEAIRAEQARPKVDGWCALDAALGARVFDFRIAISSLAAVVGGVGLAAYAAANAALNAHVDLAANRPNGSGWIGVAWGGDFGPEGITGTLGVDLLQRLIARGEPGTWVVSPASPRSDRQTPLARANAAQTQGDRATTAAKAAPTRAEAERALAEIWHEALGTAPATLDQNFFEAGGDSVSAVQVVVRINERFGAELPVAVFMDQPTIVAVAGRLAPPEVVAESEAGGARTRRGALRRERRIGGDDA